MKETLRHFLVEVEFVCSRTKLALLPTIWTFHRKARQMTRAVWRYLAGGQESSEYSISALFWGWLPVSSSAVECQFTDILSSLLSGLVLVHTII